LYTLAGLKGLNPVILVVLLLPVTLTSFIMMAVRNAHAPFGSFIAYAASNWIVLLFLYVILKRWDLVKEVFRFSKFKSNELVAAIVAFLIGIFIVYPVINFITSSIGTSMRGMNFKITSGLVFTIIVFWAVITSPFVEEVLFRGLGIGYLSAKGFPPIISGIAIISLFSLIHIPYFGIGGAIFITVWSILPTYLRLSYNNLTPGWLMHVLNNIFAYIIVPMFL
jgi:hypothetical protein